MSTFFVSCVKELFSVEEAIFLPADFFCSAVVGAVIGTTRMGI